MWTHHNTFISCNKPRCPLKAGSLIFGCNRNASIYCNKLWCSLNPCSVNLYQLEVEFEFETSDCKRNRRQVFNWGVQVPLNFLSNRNASYLLQRTELPANSESSYSVLQSEPTVWCESTERVYRWDRLQGPGVCWTWRSLSVLLHWDAQQGKLQTCN